VVLNSSVLEVLPELLHGAMGALLVYWRRRTGLVGSVDARRSRGSEGGRPDGGDVHSGVHFLRFDGAGEGKHGRIWSVRWWR